MDHRSLKKVVILKQNYTKNGLALRVCMMNLNTNLIVKAFKKAEAVAESSYYKSMFDHKTNSTKRLGIT